MVSKAPSVLTSHDFLKCAALALMIVDHVGAFFYPDQEWLRVAGRFSAPIWLFLIGFARTRDLPPRLWIGALILTMTSVVFGAPILPLTILITMILARLVIDTVMERVAARPESLYPVAVLLFFLTFPTFMFFEYGAAALLPVMIGYMTRNAGSLPFKRDEILRFAFVAGILYALMELVVFLSFSEAQKVVAGVGLVLLFAGLTGFRALTYEALTSSALPAFVWLVKIGGRWTLEIYVLHLVIFHILYSIVQREEISFFTFHVFS